jgi:transposase
MERKRDVWLGMERVKEVLRLWELGANKTEISHAVGATRATVRDYLSRAKVAGLTYADVAQMGATELRAVFDKAAPGRRVKDKEIDFLHVQCELSRPAVTLMLLWEEYLRDRPEGYSYSQFCVRFRQWRQSQKLSMRRNYRAGEVMFVDYAGMKVGIFDRETGELLFEAPIFVATLGASNRIYAEATENATMVHWLGSHERAFRYYGGVTEQVVPDNTKTGVKQACFYDPELNPTYRDFAEHYHVAILPTRPNKPKDKGKVEKGVQIVEQRILARLRDRRFYSIAELNEAIWVLLAELDEREMQGYGISRRALFELTDKTALKPLPATAYCFAAWKKAKVNIDYHVEVKRHWYSVPFQLIQKQVQVRLKEHTVEVLYEGRRVALHVRDDTPGRASTLKEHMPPSHHYMQGWTPSRFLHWAGKVGDQTKKQVNSLLLSREHLEQSYRACLGLLGLEKKYGKDRLETACAKANRLGIVSMRSIKNMLVSGTEKMAEEQPQAVGCFRHGNIRGDTEFH